MPEGRTWKTAGEQEDWLKTKGKLLGVITAGLANRLRDDFPTLPPQVVHLVFGYITPVAAEYVRRAIWRNTTLSVYEKAQLYSFTLRTYAYVIDRYKGHFGNVEQCIDEIVHGPMAPSDATFFARMQKVTPFFDEYFRTEKRDNDSDDNIDFAAAFLAQIVRVLRQSGSSAVLNVGPQDSTRIMEAFDATARTIQQMLAN